MTEKPKGESKGKSGERDPATLPLAQRRLVAVPTPAPNEISIAQSDRDEGVDPYSFYAPSPNSPDSTKVWARLEQESASVIEQLILTGLFRWKNTSDFVRWAVIEGINRAVRLTRDPELNNAVHAMNVILRSIRLKQKQTEMETALRDTESFLVDMVKAGAIRQVKVEVTAIRKEVDRMRESFFKDRAEKMLAKYDSIISQEEQRADDARAQAAELRTREARKEKRAKRKVGRR